MFTPLQHIYRLSRDLKTDRYSLSVICLRIGWVPRGDKKPGKEIDPWLRSLWLSKRDLIQVVTKSIEAKNIRFKTLYAMSNNKPMKWDLLTTLRTLNYKPKDGINDQLPDCKAGKTDLSSHDEGE